MSTDNCEDIALSAGCRTKLKIPGILPRCPAPPSYARQGLRRPACRSVRWTRSTSYPCGPSTLKAAEISKAGRALKAALDFASESDTIDPRVMVMSRLRADQQVIVPAGNLEADADEDERTMTAHEVVQQEVLLSDINLGTGSEGPEAWALRQEVLKMALLTPTSEADVSQVGESGLTPILESETNSREFPTGSADVERVRTKAYDTLQQAMLQESLDEALKLLRPAPQALP
eukprot:gnl/TRDRNA2_/TRDRNA2_180150_c0_seq1.p1 gnl/TRDRNA2_/TRDRNA2_180150_c0~~gnl/TRDRNA2_/TRDRNA2_180150_c0_seq1.p1  ORF type:complete len:232 (+),score=40.97 gnl/TRDRNA2_/TRDRNA2_180150_c0_seq1:71-766(+)